MKWFTEDPIGSVLALVVAVPTFITGVVVALLH